MSGDPRVRSAIVVLVPEADAVVGRWRGQLDPSARAGMTAHVTVIAPWIDPADIGEDHLEALRGVAADVEPFTVTLGEFDRFPRTLWLAPRPADPFVRLTLAVERRWPEFPPFSGRFPTIVPHLTIGDSVDPDTLGHVVADVAPKLPVTTQVSELTLMTRGAGGHWDVRAVVRLGRSAG